MTARRLGAYGDTAHLAFAGKEQWWACVVSVDDGDSCTSPVEGTNGLGAQEGGQMGGKAAARRR